VREHRNEAFKRLHVHTAGHAVARGLRMNYIS
jgi:hypothetical protein